MFNDTATTEISTLSLHDALPISRSRTRAVHGSRGSGVHRTEKRTRRLRSRSVPDAQGIHAVSDARRHGHGLHGTRSEEHTSELQSRRDLVCRLLLETKKSTILPN